MDVELERRHILFYDYVENAAEARAPHREAHLELLGEWKSDGRILDGGAVGDPPTGAAIVFASGDTSDAETFAGLDPYVTNGVVTQWRVEPWNVVVL
jgi:uncharacterized protein YciI